MNSVWNEKCIFSPSLITLDMCNLEEQVKELEKGGIRMIHIDIVDGYFSPSMPLGLDTVRQLRKKTDLPFDCHVMASEPDYFISELLDIGVQQIVFHAETEPHIDGMLNRIHAAGVRAGVALKPATPVTVLDYVIEKCDTVLLMLINPGYAFLKGEKQVDYADRKIKDLKKLITGRHAKTLTELDGRISQDNIRKYAGKEAQIFVVGSTCLKAGHLQESLAELESLKKTLAKGR